jgi:hypothetical protein
MLIRDPPENIRDGMTFWVVSHSRARLPKRRDYAIFGVVGLQLGSDKGGADQTPIPSAKTRAEGLPSREEESHAD